MLKNIRKKQAMSAKEIDRTPPNPVAKNAEKGLKLREKFGRGGTQVGINRAHQLKDQKPLTSQTITRMVSYFARHEVDKEAENFGNDDNPSKGYIAWLLWGGDEAKAWSEKIKKALDDQKK